MQRFLCDHMLIRLGRWLRAAGYDTRIADGTAGDRDILDLAVREDRLLVTRDRKLVEFRDAPGRVILLASNAVETCAAELTERQAIDWLHRPFTRCLDCNALLEAATAELRARARDRSEETAADFRWCGQCRRLYWPGGHFRRMQRRLLEWRNGHFMIAAVDPE